MNTQFPEKIIATAVAAKPEAHLDHCSWFFVALSFIATTSFSGLRLNYAITKSTWSLKIGRLFLPLVGTCMVIALFLRPKEEGKAIKILHLQFFIFAILSEAALAVGKYIEGENFLWLIMITLRPLFWCAAYKLGLMLRRKAAKLSQARLSKFLCNTVLLGGVGAMGPMTFFSFETLSCFASNGLENDQCENTSHAAMFLSLNLAVIAIISIGGKVVTTKERGEGLTYETLAILKLNLRHKIQGTLLVITVMTSFYLFSVLGVEGDANTTILYAGGVGMLTTGIATLIEMFYLAVAGSRVMQQAACTSVVTRPALSGAQAFLSDRRLSLSKVEKDIATMGIV